MLGKPNNRLLAGYCQPHDQFLRSIGPHLAKDKQTAFADFPERFAVEVAGLSGDVMVLSSEHCHSQLTNATSLMVMRDLLSPHFSEIRIVCYFRELAAVAKSFYSTAIKGGISASFAEFLNNCTPQEPALQCWSWFRPILVRLCHFGASVQILF